ncbi:hypothetical protein EJB05_27392, partial [Eragrostis curvula]
MPCPLFLLSLAGAAAPCCHVAVRAFLLLSQGQLCHRGSFYDEDEDGLPVTVWSSQRPCGEASGCSVLSGSRASSCCWFFASLSKLPKQ